MITPSRHKAKRSVKADRQQGFYAFCKLNSNLILRDITHQMKSANFSSAILSAAYLAFTYCFINRIYFKITPSPALHYGGETVNFWHAKNLGLPRSRTSFQLRWGNLNYIHNATPTFALNNRIKFVSDKKWRQ